MNEIYDVVVIGSGPSGLEVAQTLGKKDWKVAMVEGNGFGGTCPLRGCTPKKLLATVTEMVGKVNRLDGTGLVADPSIDWKQLIDYKNAYIGNYSTENKRKLIESGVAIYEGYGSFIGTNQVQIGKQVITGNKIVIAAGAKPMQIPIEGAEHLLYSDDFLDLETLPKRILFIGGGYISYEFAHIAAQAGSKVDIIQRGTNVLTGFDEAHVDLLIKASADIGIATHLHASVSKVEKTAHGYIVTAERDGSDIQFETDLVIASIGRVPAVKGMDLEAANIKYDKKGIAVNPFLQSLTNPAVYAVGDIANTKAPQLTPIAHLDAKVVIENLMNGNEEKANYGEIPSVAFTSPKIGSVGMTEKEAQTNGRPIQINNLDVSNWFTYKHKGEKYAQAKILIDRADGSIVGAHLLSDEADELINFFAMAVQLSISVEELKKVIFAFPTATSDISRML